MGLFDLFTSKKQGNGEFIRIDSNGTTGQPDITEEVFSVHDKSAAQPAEPLQTNINVLFDFLDRNHEQKGYDDALMNPDSTHLEHHLQSLKNELTRTIRRVKTFYEDAIKEIDFHIDSRSRTGMIDTVDELKMKREIAQSHIEKVKEIEKDALDNRGDSQGIMLSYTTGFRNGLAAISHHTFTKKF